MDQQLRLLSQSYDHWLSRMRPSTAILYARTMARFRLWLKDKGSRFADMTFDEWVLYQQENYRSYEFLDLIQGYAVQAGKRQKYRAKEFSSLRSFWLHNRVSLPPDLSFKIRGDLPKVTGTLTREEFKTVLGKSNPLHRAIFLCMFMSGMGAGELVYWSKNGLASTLDQLGRNVRILRIELPGRKKRKYIDPYYTVMGRDAINLLRIYIEEHRPGGAENSVFYNQFDKDINEDSIYEYWIRKLKQLGLVTVKPGDSSTRYGKNLHELRDLFRSSWEKSPSKGVTAEYLMGHKVDPLEYNKAFRDFDYVKAQYLQAENWLNILSEDPSSVPREQNDELVNRQQIEIDNLKADVETMKAAIRVVKEVKEEIQDLDDYE